MEYGQIKLKMMILGMCCCTRKDKARQGGADHDLKSKKLLLLATDTTG